MSHVGIRHDDLDIGRGRAHRERSESKIQAAADAAGDAPAHEPVEVDPPLCRLETLAYGGAGYERHVAFLAGLAARRVGPARPLAIGGQHGYAPRVRVLVAGGAEKRARLVEGRVRGFMRGRLCVLQRTALDLARLEVEWMIRAAQVHVGDRVAEVAGNTLPS